MAEISDEQLERMLERASDRAANKILHGLGLHDDNAPRDVAELRELLETWRDVRKTALRTATGMLTAFILGALALGTAMGILGKGTGQ
jgi:hypothetical protein